MKFCQNHRDMLRQEIADQGLAGWVAPDGETAIAQLVDNIQRGEDTPVNYDPLMACHNMILERSLRMAGLMVMTEDFGCPVCFFNTHRTPDGRCDCGQPECKAQEPGSIPDFEGWLVGPGSCVTAAKDHMARQGWLGGDAS